MHIHSYNISSFNKYSSPSGVPGALQVMEGRWLAVHELVRKDLSDEVTVKAGPQGSTIGSDSPLSAMVASFFTHQNGEI